MIKNYILKTKKQSLLLITLMLFSVTINSQTTLIFEDFEDATVGYTLRDESNDVPLTEDISQAFADEDYFGRVSLADLDPADNLGFSGFQGSRFFGANDYDGIDQAPYQVTTDLVSINWNNINITGFAGVNVSALFAEGNSANGNEAWDGFDGMRNATVLRVEYSFNNSNWTPIFSIVGNDVNSTNTFPVVDANNDNIGDGPQITEAFSAVSGSFATSGNNNVSIRIFLNHFTGTDEDIAFDNLTIQGLTTLSTTDLSFKDAISYTNPVNQELVFNSAIPISAIELYDLTGKMVGQSNSNLINVDFLPSGLYMANITSESGQKAVVKVAKK